jgi:hypothetical protein
MTINDISQTCSNRALAAAVTLVGILILTADTAPAEATTTTTPTSVRIVEQKVFEPPTHMVLGDLDSTASKCLDNRRVRLYFDYADEPIEWVQVDVARSSVNGNWAGSGFMNNQFGFVSFIKARLIRKDIGRAGHRHICGGSTTIISTGTG